MTRAFTRFHTSPRILIRKENHLLLSITPPLTPLLRKFHQLRLWSLEVICSAMLSLASLSTTLGRLEVLIRASRLQQISPTMILTSVSRLTTISLERSLRAFSLRLLITQPRMITSCLPMCSQERSSTQPYLLLLTRPMRPTLVILSLMATTNLSASSDILLPPHGLASTDWTPSAPWELRLSLPTRPRSALLGDKSLTRTLSLTSHTTSMYLRSLPTRLRRDLLLTTSASPSSGDSEELMLQLTDPNQAF